MPLEFVHPARKEGLAGTGGADQQQGCARAAGDLFDALDHRVEGDVARRDAGLEERHRVLSLAPEALRDPVVAREVEVDDRVTPDTVGDVLAPWRRCLQQARRQVACLGEQKPADLRDMAAGGDVDQVVLVLGIERVGTREIVQRRIHLLEVPGVAQRHLDVAHLGFRRHRRDVETGSLREAAAAFVMQHFESMHQQVFLLAKPDRRTPLLPTRATAATVVELRAEEADDDGSFHALSPAINYSLLF